MTGIYYWKNKITNKYYIGQSIDISKRLTQHKWAYQQQNQKYPLYIEMRNYGIENFEWGILEECSIDELDQKEIYWIKKFNSYLDGYNLTSGGQGIYIGIGENNGRTKLTNLDVLIIRKRVYINKEDMWTVYQDYNTLVGKDRFWSLVHGDTWKNVDTSMIYSLKENGYKNFKGSNNPKARLTEEDVKHIRYEIEQNKINPNVLYESEYKEKISKSAFRKVVRYDTWKNIKY